MGMRTLLLTHNIETLGQMSCNPAIGGIGKGHLVKEIDALGGAMALAADQAGIQFRTLNASKGPAVRATRAQADRQLYKRAIRRCLETQAEPADLPAGGGRSHPRGRARRRRGDAERHRVSRAAPWSSPWALFWAARSMSACESHAGGRAGDPPSMRLAARLRELKLRVGRLKTGTPPRIDGRSIDFSGLREQHSDEPRPVFSYLGSRAPRIRASCPATSPPPTSAPTTSSARRATRSPLFTGLIEGAGPRYCPSVEDKVVRFADRTSHQIFIEPEGLDTHEIYPNGISTSLPFDVQYEFVRSHQGIRARAHHAARVMPSSTIFSIRAI